MPGMPWIKLYTEMLDDMKIARLDDSQKWRFIQLILLAAECDAEGALVTGDNPVTHDDLVWRLRCDKKQLSLDLELLLRVGLIYYEDDVVVVTKFVDRQGPTQEAKRAQWRERQRKHRQRVNNGQVTSDTLVTTAEVTPLEEEEELKSEEVDAPRFRLLFDAFLEGTGIIETNLDLHKAADVIREWVEAGYEPAQIKQAVGEMNTKGYSITGPWSVTKWIRNMTTPYEREASEVY